jgi:SAM-dependent methyltransferase
MTAMLMPAPGAVQGAAPSLAALPPGLYSRAILEAFAAGEHAAFLAGGGRPLRPRLARALALADLAPGLRLADVGCGRGEASAHALRRGAVVTALDFSRDGLELTRETAQQVLGARPAADLALLQAEASRLPLASASMDRVLLLDVVEHLRDWQVAALLGEVRRILAPGGLAVIHTLPNRWALDIGYPLLRGLLPGLPADPRSDYERAVHVNEQSPRQLRGSLRDAGLGGRVWLEEWSTRQARNGRGRDYPDAPRRLGYPQLARPLAGRLGRLAMRSPLRSVAANDIFALAWRADGPAPEPRPRWRPVN